MAAARVPDFVSGGEFTVGVEDELMLVDDEGELLGARAVPLVADLVRRHEGPGVVVGEVYADQVEVSSPVCRDGEQVHASLVALRSSVMSGGVRILSAGVHPTAPLGAAVASTSSRYDRIVDEFAGLLRTPTAAFQVHVGLPDEDALMLAYRGLRQRLPLLRALEVRVMDAIPSVELAGGLAALVQGIARRAVEQPDRLDLSDGVLGINDDRVARHGLDTRVVDVDHELRPLREVAARTLSEARATLAVDGLDAPLDAVEARLAREPEPTRQRRIEGTAGMRVLLDDLVARTGEHAGDNVG